MHYKSDYISLPSSAKQQREMTKFCVVYGTWTTLLIGAEQYYNRHKENASNFSLVMESDIGTFMPKGISFTGSEKAVAIMREVMSLLKPINVTDLRYWW